MDQSQNPSYLVYGAGALGSVLGGFLQEIGRRVTYAGRGAHFQALQESGLKITGIWGDHFIPPEEIDALSSEGGPEKRYSIILLSVKSKDTEAVAREAAPLLQEDGIMVSIQNGLNNWEAIAGFVGEERTVGARVIFGAEIPTPGQARVTVNADDVLLGEPFLPVNRLLLQTLQEDFSLSGIPTRIVGKDEIWAALWGKVLYNCSLNPLGAMLEVPYGKLGENEEAREIIRIIIKEIFQVCQGLGVTLPHKGADDYYRHLLETLIPPTAGHRASMLQDIQAGRRTEIDALNGAISGYARRLGISTPYNDLITNLIKFKEKPQNQGKGRSTGPDAP
jgi:2-dehydropantoate 2-reductase